jgi:hypothetical protein
MNVSDFASIPIADCIYLLGNYHFDLTRTCRTPGQKSEIGLQTPFRNDHSPASWHKAS